MQRSHSSKPSSSLLDPRYVGQNEAAIKENLIRRQAHSQIQNLEKIIELNRSRSELIQQLDTERAERKTISRNIHALLKQGKPEEAELVKKQVAVISENAKKLKTELDRVEIERDQLFMALPNVMDERVPNGDDETDNEVLYEWWPEEVDHTIT